MLAGLILGHGATQGLGQQTGANLQWLPHPAVVAQRVRPTAAEIPASPSAVAPIPQGNTSNSGIDIPPMGPMPAAPNVSPVVPPAPGPGAGKSPFADPFGDIAPAPPAESIPRVLETPSLPGEGAKPIPSSPPTPPSLRPTPHQVRAECITDANLLLPIHKLTTRIEIDQNVHPEISPEEEARLRREGKPTRLEQLTRTKAEFDAKMWCEPPPSPLPDRMTQAWPETTMTWKASALCHKPLYFEQAHLERYGHTTGPLTQPIISAGHFFLMMPILPYQLALWPPYECMYPLGYYRPGNCAPYYLDPIPLSIRAGLAEAGAWVAGPFIVP